MQSKHFLGVLIKYFHHLLCKHLKTYTAVLSESEFGVLNDSHTDM